MSFNFVIIGLDSGLLPNENQIVIQNNVDSSALRPPGMIPKWNDFSCI